MRKKAFRLALCAMLFALCVPANAQQAKKVPRIGFFGIGSPSATAPLSKAFRQGLRQLGYIEGQNILIEYRYAEGYDDRVPPIVAELVGLKVDVLVTGSLTMQRTAKKATTTIPVVMAQSPDPVVLGLVDSLARPGGNITGLSSITSELGGKRLELLKEAVPKI